MYSVLHVRKCPLFLSFFNETCISRQIFENTPNIKFHENPSSGSRVVSRGRIDMMKLIFAFRNFANAPKMYNDHHVKYSLFLPDFNET